MLFPDETPQVCKRTDGDVECAVGLHGDVLSELQHGEKFRGNDHCVRGGTGVDAGKFAVLAVNTHHGIRALEFLERGGNGVECGGAVGAVGGDGNERAEQRLTAVDEFSFGAWQICPARGQQAEQDAAPTQTSPARA